MSRRIEPEDRVTVYLVVRDVLTDDPIADIAGAGEDSKLSARTTAALLRAVADDLDPAPARPAPRRR